MEIGNYYSSLLLAAARNKYYNEYNGAECKDQEGDLGSHYLDILIGS